MAMITAPASRQLAVADLARSISFYRDVLGFEVRGEHELVSGPARVELVIADRAYDSTLQSRPRGSASLFFETDDVTAMRAAIAERGGTPSEIEKVNGIKMRMFEVRDPDGHVVWFGQSFQEPDQPREAMRQLRQFLPELPVTSVSAAVAYYKSVLGFQVNYAQDDFAVMFRDDGTLCLIPRTERQPGIGSCYAYIRDADALHAELVARGANVLGEPVSRPWGLRDFQVLDLDGNRLTFGQTFE